MLASLSPHVKAVQQYNYFPHGPCIVEERRGLQVQHAKQPRKIRTDKKWTWGGGKSIFTLCIQSNK